MKFTFTGLFVRAPVRSTALPAVRVFVSYLSASRGFAESSSTMPCSEWTGSPAGSAPR
jgi:hypothetical protein